MKETQITNTVTHSTQPTKVTQITNPVTKATTQITTNHTLNHVKAKISSSAVSNNDNNDTIITHNEKQQVPKQTKNLTRINAPIITAKHDAQINITQIIHICVTCIMFIIIIFQSQESLRS